MSEILLETDLPNRVARGKVRDIFDLGENLLVVATDRISAFDVVLPTGIPRKGEVLTRLSAWWFERTREVVPNHFIALITEENASLVPFKLDSRYFGRTMLVRKARRLNAECIARGYLSGSGRKEYQRTGAICGTRPSFDKQPVRDWMAANWQDGDPAPVLPPVVVAATTERYIAAYRAVTGEELPA